MIGKAYSWQSSLFLLMLFSIAHIPISALQCDWSYEVKCVVF